MTPCPSDGDLRAFVDGALPADVQAGLDRHVQSCPDCAVRAHDLRTAASFAADHLTSLGALPDAPATNRAWRRLQARRDTVAPPPTPRERILAMFSWLGSRSARLGLSTALAALVVVTTLAVTPAGSAAVQALSVFRVTTFKALTIEVDPATLQGPTAAQRKDMERRQPADVERGIRDLQGELAKVGVVLKTTIGNQTAREVANLAAAQQAAKGTPVRTVTALPAALANSAPSVYVADASKSSLTVDLTRFRQALRDNAKDAPKGTPPVDPSNLPGIDPNATSVSATVDTSFSVVQVWGDDSQSLIFAHGPSPVLTLSEGIDVKELCLALRASPVLSKTNRAQLNSICSDPNGLTSTLFIPVPVGATVKDVNIGGIFGIGGDPALLVLDPNGKGGAVFAQRNGILYVVAGSFGEQALLQAMNSIK